MEEEHPALCLAQESDTPFLAEFISGLKTLITRKVLLIQHFGWH